MTEPIAYTRRSVLDYPVFSRIRRNHGLEHATLHVLSKSNPGTRMAGHSDMNGFWILGDVSLEDVRSAVQEALLRLRNGEKSLAVHPNCGTNFATAGISAGVAASLAMFGAGSRLRNKLERVPLAITLATLALIIAQPLGMKVQQQVTTSGDPEGLEVVEIRKTTRGRVQAYRVVTEG